MILTTLFYLAMLIANLSLWVPRPGESIPVLASTDTALSMNLVMFIMACGGVLLDLVIWTLPLYAISRLDLTGSKKCCVACIFFVGLIAVVASCISVVYRGRSNSDWNGDFLFYSYPAVLSTFIELSCGCVAASLPHLLIFRAHLSPQSRMRIGIDQSGQCSPTASKTFPLATAAESGCSFTGTPDRARQQYLHRKASTLSDGVATISEHMAHPFSKLGDAFSLSRRSSVNALPQLERPAGCEQDITLDELNLAPPPDSQPRRPHRKQRSYSDDATMRNASALAALDEQAQQLSAQSFENFRSREVDPQERWEALKNWPPEPKGWGDAGSDAMGLEKGKVTNRYAFGD